MKNQTRIKQFRNTARDVADFVRNRVDAAAISHEIGYVPRCGIRTFAALICLLIPAIASAADPKAEPRKPVKHQITGLFSKDREQDLRDVVESIPNIKLVSVDFANAEATFEYDPTAAFPNTKADQLIQRFDAVLRSASYSTFGVKPLRSVPLEKLKPIDIPVEGLDCKACALAAYEAIYRIDGVEQATASFKERRVTALIDPAKTDRAKLEAALKQKGVQLKVP
jgi:copper chaperone CopZ